MKPYTLIRRLRSGLLYAWLLGNLCLLLPGANPIGSQGLGARTLPTYAILQKKVPELWNARYPLKAHGFLANPEKLGILSTRHKGRSVYYYHFQAKLKRPQRNKNESLGYGDDLRKVEFWVRYRPGLKEPYDLSFARRDLLPGSNRRWIKSR